LNVLVGAFLLDQVDAMRVFAVAALPGVLGAFASPTPSKKEFQIGGYLENWKTYDGYQPFNTVYYAFLTLDSHPNADSPRDVGWDGSALYETMTLAPVMDVMNKTDPAWENPYEWQRSKIAAVMNACKSKGQVFMWAVGGWSDLQRTISDAQIPALAEQIVGLLKLGGDGVDFDWEHLSTSADASVNTQQRAVLGKFISALRSKLNANGMSDKHISYTTRWNCFWSSADAQQYGALTFASDGECLDTFSHASPSDVSWVNLMMYDAGPGTAFKGKRYFDIATYQSVLQAGTKIIDKSKIVMGFEPGHQATDGIWEGFDIDFQVIDDMMQQGYGGVMFWAINEAATDQNAGTPNSSKHTWQGNTGANAQYIASNAASLSKAQAIVV